MQPGDFDRFQRAFELMAWSKGHKDSKQIEAKAFSFFEQLKDFDAEIIVMEDALKNITDNDRYFPTIQDIRDRCRKIESDRNKIEPQKNGRPMGCEKCSMGNVWVYTGRKLANGKREKRVFKCGHCHKENTGGTAYMTQYENKIYDVSARVGSGYKACKKPELVYSFSPVFTSEELVANFKEGFIPGPPEFMEMIQGKVRQTRRESKRVEVING